MKFKSMKELQFYTRKHIEHDVEMLEDYKSYEYKVSFNRQYDQTLGMIWLASAQELISTNESVDFVNRIDDAMKAFNEYTKTWAH